MWSKSPLQAGLRRLFDQLPKECNGCATVSVRHYATDPRKKSWAELLTEFFRARGTSSCPSEENATLRGGSRRGSGGEFDKNAWPRISRIACGANVIREIHGLF
jgi:hypothetical protein